jgi:hypothetical protein
MVKKVSLIGLIPSLLYAYQCVRALFLFIRSLLETVLFFPEFLPSLFCQNICLNQETGIIPLNITGDYVLMQRSWCVCYLSLFVKGSPFYLSPKKSSLLSKNPNYFYSETRKFKEVRR